MYKYNEDNEIFSSFSNIEILNHPIAESGAIPHWLRGTYVRNGLFSLKINDKKIHWFDEPSLLHSFKFQEKGIHYSRKFLKSEAYKKIFTEHKFNYVGFSTKTDRLIWSLLKSIFNLKKKYLINNANVNIAKINSRYIALTETPLPVEFDLKTLDTISAFIYQDNLPKQNIFESAHPIVDIKTNEHINYLIKYGRENFYTLYKVEQNSLERKIISEIPVKNPAYMHSFALTSNFVILVEFPLVINSLKLILSGKPFIENFSWHPELGTNFLIINRKTGNYESIKFKEPFFAFHHINAYEENEKIVMDIITYPDHSIISKLSDHGNLQLNENAKEDYMQNVMRFTISLKNKAISAKKLLQLPIEFPKINENCFTQKYSYLYAVDPRLLSKNNAIRPIYKINVNEGSRLSWQEAGMLPGEPIFVPKFEALNEDEGVVLSIVLDVVKKRTFLLILDGETFKEISRLYTPYCIPLGLHGQFYPE